VFVGPSLSISPLVLAAKLFAILVGAALVGFTVRRVVGPAAINRQEERIDGLNILVLFVFVAAVMESVGARFLDAPMITMALAALAFVVFFAVLALTALLFLFAGRERALALALMASQRNLGVMLAATSGALPDLTCSISLFPRSRFIYRRNSFSHWRDGCSDEHRTRARRCKSGKRDRL